MKSLYIILIPTILCLFGLSPKTETTIDQEATANISFSAEEKQLFEIITQYRRSLGLPDIPLSPSLTKVAQLHAQDLDTYPPKAPCNMHSWSSNGHWTPCCYLSDHSNMDCMHAKPRELTDYPGNGFENSFWHSNAATAEAAFNGWKNSPGHHAVMINDGQWKQPWNAIGVGIYGKYAVIWFGREIDPAGTITFDNNTTDPIYDYETTDIPINRSNEQRRGADPTTAPIRPNGKGNTPTDRQYTSNTIQLSHQVQKQQNNNYYDITIQLNGRAAELNTVKQVEYILHDTFNPNRRIIANRQNNFLLQISCWGQFTLKANVFLQDGNVIALERYLSFD